MRISAKIDGPARLVLAVILLALAWQTTPAQARKLISHRRAIRILADCKEKRFGEHACDENPLFDVMTRYWSGDVELLKGLVETSKVSDGALSEELSSFYAKILVQRPTSFLRIILGFDPNDRTNVLKMASCCTTPKQGRQIKRNLQRLGRSSGQFRTVARQATTYF